VRESVKKSRLGSETSPLPLMVGQAVSPARPVPGIAGRLILSAALLLWNTVALAQAPHGSLAGSVVDSWGTAVPDAKLTLTETATGAALSSTANQAGEYVFSQAAHGRYDLSVLAGGFKPYTRHNLEIGGDAESSLDIAMDREKDDSETAVKELETLAAAKPDDYQAHFNLGRAYLARGEFEKALPQFRETLKLRRDYPAARLNMARLALGLGSPEAALQFAQDTLALKPGDSAATVIRAEAHLRMGQTDQAAVLLDRLLDTHPYDTDALLESGVVNLRRQRYSEAEKAFRQAYNLDPSSPRGLSGVAETHLLAKEPEKAVQTIAVEVEKAPQRADLRKALAAVEFRAGQFAKAVADYRSILDNYKDSPKEQADLYARIGDAYQGQGELPLSIESFKKAEQLAPRNAAYPAELAHVYDAAGNSKEALACYAQSLRIEPGNAVVMNNAAYLLAKSGGNLDDALRLIQMARRQFPNSQDFLDTLGWVYLRKELVESACQVFQDLVEKAPANPTFHYHYALALAQKGDKAAALEQLRLALQNRPGKDEEAAINVLIKKMS